MSNVKSNKSKKTKVTVESINESVQEHIVQEPVVAPVIELVVPVSVTEPVVVPVSVTEPVATVVVEESTTELLFNKLVNQFQDVQLLMKTLHLNLKVLQKEVLKEQKDSKKKSDKKKSDKKRLPTGFAKPSPISNSLAEFLNLPTGSELARTDVTSKVIAYVKEHNLQNPENKKQILVDNKLKQLLSVKDEDVVTYFNLQTYLKNHFSSQTSTVTEATVL